MPEPIRSPTAWTRLMACRRRVLDDWRPSEEARRARLARRPLVQRLCDWLRRRLWG
jgi:hypothetical protein